DRAARRARRGAHALIRLDEGDRFPYAPLMGRRTRGIGGLLGLLVVAVLVAAPAAIARPNPLQQAQSAQTLVAKIPHNRFARGRRLAMMSYARRYVKLAKGKHPCPTLVAADAMHSYLGTPTTWQKNRVPKKLVRPLLRLLNGAERRLLRRAGERCARASAEHKLAPHTGGSGSPMVQPPPTD